MRSVLIALLRTAQLSMRSRGPLHLEILALRHQVHVLGRSRRRRVRLTQADRLLWIWLSRVREQWRSAHPTAAWTAQQLREAFPRDDTPRYLVRDRDLAFAGIGATAAAMTITEVLTAPR